MRHYDCAVIGTGPAGQKAAIQAAKLGKHVAIVERNNVVGPYCGSKPRDLLIDREEWLMQNMKKDDAAPKSETAA